VIFVLFCFFFCLFYDVSRHLYEKKMKMKKKKKKRKEKEKETTNTCICFKWNGEIDEMRIVELFLVVIVWGVFLSQNI
jgi:hypothetical protein